MIQQPSLFRFSLILLAAFGILLIERTIFLVSAVRTTGQVMNVLATESTCGSGGRYAKSYPCLRYTARIGFFATDNHHYELSISDGSQSLRPGNSVRNQDYATGQLVPIIYSKRNPNIACEDRIMGIFKWPIYTLALQFLTMIASFCRPRQKFWFS